ncbi:HlyD family type I secretion periplasmic adaptor subunit [Proteus vulgaris]|uniref:Membrane fusion protein (MFP) family protein n=1 Tax=Proteus faecis TaxID=2050967 RepID=A0ABZ3EP77_9GAMM|nr:HlyD family type I secretion periplasmic adaptor subunit [Proteus vulgaris]
MKFNLKSLNLFSFKKFFIKKEKINYDFYPNHIALIEKPHTPYSHYIAMLLSLSVVILLFWSYIGKLDIQAPAIGKLIVSGHSQRIQVYEHSRLMEIHVENGQFVNQGDPLLTLDVLGVDEEIKKLQSQIKITSLLKTRYQALNQNVIPQSLNHYNLLDSKTQQSVVLSYQKEKEEFDSILKGIDTEIEILHKNKALIKKDLNSLIILKNNIEHRFNIIKSLYDKKIISKMEYLENEKELIDINSKIATKTSESSILLSQEKHLQDNLAQTKKKKALEWYDKYKQYENELVTYTQSLNHLQKRQQLKIIKAPVSGTVQQREVHTLGAVLQPSQNLMVIVPETQRNIAEVNILNKDIGFIRKDQKAIVKIDAFPYTRYGTINGKIINIAKDSVQHEQLGLVYPAFIELDEQFIKTENEEYPLTAGMSLVAEIIIDKRRVIDYLLTPIDIYRHEALREK